MPTVAIYYRNNTDESAIKDLIASIKSFIAERISCSDILVTPDAVSVRMVYVEHGDGMLADIELDITAANFPERIKKQDQICLDVQAYVKQRVAGTTSVNVWLKLHELGHSFE